VGTVPFNRAVLRPSIIFFFLALILFHAPSLCASKKSLRSLLGHQTFTGGTMGKPKTKNVMVSDMTTKTGRAHGWVRSTFFAGDLKKLHTSGVLPAT
jgi:hypothetical protein